MDANGSMDTVNTWYSGMPELIPSTISEEIARRDNFFHSAWMVLKSKRPDLWEIMTEIELLVSNISPPPKKEDEEKEQNDDIEIL